MARTALEYALPAGWPDARASSEIDEVFDEHRERQYPRDLLFSTVVELVTLVSRGLRPSLHAAARTMDTRPVTLAALYDKVNRTEPAIPTPEVSAPPDGVVEAVMPEGFPFSTRDPIHQVDGAGAARIMDWFPIHTCR